MQKFARILMKKADNSGVAMLVMGLFHARTLVHLLHFKTRSYARHVALNELYDALPGLADRFVEAYQGRYGIIEEYPMTPAWDVSDPVEFVRSLQSWFRDYRTVVPSDSELQNLLDELASQIDSSLYKLQNLS